MFKSNLNVKFINLVQFSVQIEYILATWKQLSTANEAKQNEWAANVRVLWAVKTINK